MSNKRYGPYQETEQLCVTFGKHPTRRDLTAKTGEVIRQKTIRGGGHGVTYLEGSYVSGLYVTGMCEHDCVHIISRTQTTSHAAAKTVSSQEYISWGVDRASAETNPTAPILS
jgi:hypothetical protein